MTTLFPTLGQHCSTCNQLDFLPFRCNSCHLYHCLEHRNNHQCNSFKDNQAHFCPICGTSIIVKPGEELDYNLCLHLTNECGSPTIKHVECIVKGCRRYDKDLNITCKLCKKPVCLKHRFEKDHNCL
jgi:AN1-like Zinc finger